MTSITIDDIVHSDFGDFVKKKKNKSEPKSSDLFAFGDPNGNYPNAIYPIGHAFGFIIMF